jgi:hypothetical protein
MVLDRSAVGHPILWVRDDVPEAAVKLVLDATQPEQQSMPHVQP